MRTQQLPSRVSGGFSVIELMVAIAVSLILLAGVVAMFANSRRSYETTERFSRVQETGRFALDTLTRDIRTSGFAGCARAANYVSTSLATTSVAWNFLEGAVRGFEAGAADMASSGVSPATGTDVLVLRRPRPDAQPLRLTANMTGATAALTVQNLTTGVRTDDVALAYSCEAQAYFHVSSFASGTVEHAVPGTAPTTGPYNSVNTLSYAFRTGAEVVPVETVVYYIAASSQTTGVNSLWRRIGDNAVDELVEGVDRMELEFGVDTNGDFVVDNYQSASAVTNWGNVLSVSLALLVRSNDAYDAQESRTYQLLSSTYTAPANDRYVRQVFEATASIRNRIPVT
ncbi:MAG: PilW family protein [Steroidobacteraceae bacterium]